MAKSYLMNGKKFLYRIFIFQPFLFTITCCSPLSKCAHPDFQAEVITKENYKLLNGIYANSFDTITGTIKHTPPDGLHDDDRLTILSQLFYITPKESWYDSSYQRIEKSDKWIKLEFQSDKC